MKFNENSGFTYQEEMLIKKFLKEYEESLLHETAVGNPITIGDVSPIEHTLDVTVKSSNMFDERVFARVPGIKVNADGSITVPGENTETRDVRMKDFCPDLRPGDKVWFNRLPKISLNIFYLPGANKYINTFTEYTITQEILDSSIIIYANKAPNLTMSEFKCVRTQDTPYMPYDAKLEGTKVTVPGKNLYSRDSLGPVKANDAGVIRTGFILPPAVYTASTDTLKEGLYIKKSVNGKLDESPHDIGLNKTITFDGKNSDYVVIYSASASEFDKYKNLQIELGDTKTAYEPYQKSIYTVSDDNKVYGVESKSPNMTISADSGLLEVTYLADINKWLHKLREQLGE